MQTITFGFGNHIPTMTLYKGQDRFCYWAKAEMSIEVVTNLLEVLLKWNDYKDHISQSALPIESIGLQIAGSLHMGNIFVTFYKNKIAIDSSIYKYNDHKSGDLSFEIENHSTYEDIITSLRFAKKYKENNCCIIIDPEKLENLFELVELD